MSENKFAFGWREKVAVLEQKDLDGGEAVRLLECDGEAHQRFEVDLIRDGAIYVVWTFNSELEARKTFDQIVSLPTPTLPY